jgi:glycosyltransferase involved in cell wall biosynthesis
MEIVLVSRGWPVSERSGVPLTAEKHLGFLINRGHSVSIVGSSENIFDCNYKDVKSIDYVYSRGSGALYSPSKIDSNKLRFVLEKNHPDLIIVESWQTALTDKTIDLAYQLKIPILMISHGISVSPFTKRFIDLIRFVGWIPYRFLRLPERVRKLSGITCLDLKAKSDRFLDRDIALKFEVPLYYLPNAPVNVAKEFVPRVSRKKQILVIGYFSNVKNQLEALRIIERIIGDYTIKFIGPKTGDYFHKCEKKVKKLNLESRVIFSQDIECNIAEEISISSLVLMTSVTEVLPLTLLEAMASGTPFVSSAVGAVASLKGGLAVSGFQNKFNAVNLLIRDSGLWDQLSFDGREAHRRHFNDAFVEERLDEIVNQTVKLKSDAEV